MISSRSGQKKKKKKRFGGQCDIIEYHTFYLVEGCFFFFFIWGKCSENAKYFKACWFWRTEVWLFYSSTQLHIGRRRTCHVCAVCCLHCLPSRWSSYEIKLIKNHILMYMKVQLLRKVEKVWNCVFDKNHYYSIYFHSYSILRLFFKGGNENQLLSCLWHFPQVGSCINTQVTRVLNVTGGGLW